MIDFTEKNIIKLAENTCLQFNSFDNALTEYVFTEEEIINFIRQFLEIPDANEWESNKD